MTDTTSRFREPTPAEIESEIHRRDAEARKFNAEADLAIRQAETAEAVASATKIELEREQYKRRVETSQNEYRRVWNFNGAVTDHSVYQTIEALSRWMRLDEEDELLNREYTIVFNSPGGEITAGMALYDFLVQKVRIKHGHPLRTETIGMAASMAGILLQAGTVRAMAPESWLLIHKGSMGAVGDFDKVSERVKLMERIHERILGIFESRIQGSDAPKKMTRRKLDEAWKRTDFWVSSDQALEWGFVDEVV